jgi:putative transposase
MDNGPELVAWALRDWCRLAGTATTYIEPRSRWANPFVESFNGRVRDELLNTEEFATLLEAQVLVEAWRIEYNTYRPPSALGGAGPPLSSPSGGPSTSRNPHSGLITQRGPLTALGTIPMCPGSDG